MIVNESRVKAKHSVLVISIKRGVSPLLAVYGGSAIRALFQALDSTDKYIGAKGTVPPPSRDHYLRSL